ncbi:hypothetical protein A3Q56_00550 [Intoshia linei]|uniref:Uncharacterized protein n=1 Tax=Intoshia linei TaxID=1819745 RepID=A0A177BBT0_9BILA|nr:hypothetical protein A3Q56_00550 [Intoshia linei]
MEKYKTAEEYEKIINQLDQDRRRILSNTYDKYPNNNSHDFSKSQYISAPIQKCNSVSSLHKTYPQNSNFKHSYENINDIKNEVYELKSKNQRDLNYSAKSELMTPNEEIFKKSYISEKNVKLKQHEIEVLKMDLKDKTTKIDQYERLNEKLMQELKENKKHQDLCKQSHDSLFEKWLPKFANILQDSNIHHFDDSLLEKLNNYLNRIIQDNQYLEEDIINLKNKSQANLTNNEKFKSNLTKNYEDQISKYIVDSNKDEEKIKLLQKNVDASKKLSLDIEYEKNNIINQLKNEITKNTEKFEWEQENWNRKRKSLEDALDDIQSKITDKNVSENDYKIQIKDLENDNAEYEKTVDILTKEREKIESNLSYFESNFKLVESHLLKEKTQNLLIQNDNRSLKQEIETYETRIRKISSDQGKNQPFLAQQISALSDRLRIVTNECADNAATVVKLQTERNHLKRQLDVKILDENTEKIYIKNEDKTKLESMIQQGKMQIDNLKIKYNDLQKKYNVLDIESNEKSDLIDQVRNDRDVVIENAEKSRIKYENMKNNIGNGLKNRIKSSNQEIQHYKHMNSTIKLQYRKLKKRLEQEQSSNSEFRNTYNNNVETLKCKYEKLSKHHSKAHGAFAFEQRQILSQLKLKTNELKLTKKALITRNKLNKSAAVLNNRLQGYISPNVRKERFILIKDECEQLKVLLDVANSNMKMMSDENSYLYNTIKKMISENKYENENKEKNQYNNINNYKCIE